MKIINEYSSIFLFKFWSMNNDKKKLFILTLILVFSFLIVGMCVGRFMMPKENPNPSVNIEKELKIIDSLQSKNDSLNNVISEYIKLNEKLKDSVEVKIVYLEKKVEIIKDMSVNENTALLRDNLLTFGDLTTETDSFPCVISSDLTDDSIVALSENNIKDVNCIIARYDSELEINKYLYSTIRNDSAIISLKDDIILNQDQVINKERLIFEQNMKSLNKQIKKERKNRNTAICGGIAATIGVGILTYLIMK